MTNLQLNKELIDKLLEQLEKDKILEEYYIFTNPNEKIKKKERKENDKK